MKQTWQIIFSGVGGQGLILAGNVLGEAVSVHEGRCAAMTSSYGVETRGTFTKSDLIVSDETIDFPEVLEPDAVIALAPVAYDKYVNALEGSSLLIYDSSAMEEQATRARQFGFPISQAAKELGNPGGANILVLGILVRLTELVDPESVEAVILSADGRKKKFAELNLKAFKAGYEMAGDVL